MRIRGQRARLLPSAAPFLGEAKEGSGDTTEVYQVDETGELRPVDLEQADPEERHARDPRGRRGAPAARPSTSAASATTIGRNPDAEIFLDDVTVSRNHALLVH